MSTETTKVTEIKRLKQQGKEFVPITLAEAVVVNTEHIPGFSTMEITTLDKVLGQYGYSLTQFNLALANKLDKLVKGAGIELIPQKDGTVRIDCSLNTTVYKVVTAEDFNTIYENPDKKYTNIIYLVPTKFKDNSNSFAEYVCIEIPGEDDTPIYKWERFGEIQSNVKLDDYVTKIEFGQVIASMITAVNVTTSEAKGSKQVIVSYSIPDTLYDDMIEIDDNDAIEIPSGS